MSSARFSALLLEGLDHYRKGRMMEAVRSWEEAYLLEPTNLRAREFLRSALERIHAHMTPNPAGGSGHPWLPAGPPIPELPIPEEMSAAAPADAPAQPPPPPPGAASPWDDGPSVAIPQAEGATEGGGASGAWSIHHEPQTPEAPESDDLAVWKGGARELIGLNDFSGALELLAKILERSPSDLEARGLYEVAEQNLTLMYESKLGSMSARPRVAIPPDEIIWLNLDPRAGFVLAQIDGEVSFEDLYAICGLKRLDTARILSQLLEEGVVRVEGQQPVAKHAR